MRKFIIFLILFFAQGLMTYAKDLKNPIEEFKKAKKYYSKQKYQEARELFENISISEPESEVGIYVKFYLALSNYHCDKKEEAKEILESLAKNNISWGNLKDVWYWLAIVYFEEKDYLKALHFLKKVEITDKDKENIEGLEFYYLDQCSDIEILKVAFRDYPNDFSIAKILINRFSSSPLSHRDVDLLRVLSVNLGLETDDRTKISRMICEKKESYNIAVFLPIFVEQMQVGESDSDFVFDFYRGLVLAVKKLEEEGILVNLCVYDTKRDAKHTAELLSKEEMLSMDLIVGPLYPETIPLVSEFSEKNEIPMINPLSENLELLEKNPFFYLFQPSIQTKAKCAAMYTLKNLDPNSKIGIVYSSTSKSDIIAANVYKNFIEQNSSFKVSVVIPVQEKDCSAFLSFYISKDKAGYNCSNYKYPTLDGITHLYVPSKNEIVARSVISAVDIMGSKMNIIADESWFNYNSIGLDQVIKLNIVFISPTYINYNENAIHDFRRRYFDEFSLLPTVYSIIGYELLILFGRMLNLHGSAFLASMIKGDEYNMEIFQKIKYHFSNDNQYVPIIGIDKSGKIVCYNE